MKKYLYILILLLLLISCRLSIQFSPSFILKKRTINKIEQDTTIKKDTIKQPIIQKP